MEKGKESCKCGDLERREGIAICKTDRKLAKSNRNALCFIYYSKEVKSFCSKQNIILKPSWDQRFATRWNCFCTWQTGTFASTFYSSRVQFSSLRCAWKYCIQVNDLTWIGWCWYQIGSICSVKHQWCLCLFENTAVNLISLQIIPTECVGVSCILANVSEHEAVLFIFWVWLFKSELTKRKTHHLIPQARYWSYSAHVELCSHSYLLQPQCVIVPFFFSFFLQPLPNSSDFEKLLSTLCYLLWSSPVRVLLFWTAVVAFILQTVTECAAVFDSSSPLLKCFSELNVILKCIRMLACSIKGLFQYDSCISTPFLSSPPAQFTEAKRTVRYVSISVPLCCKQCQCVFHPNIWVRAYVCVSHPRDSHNRETSETHHDPSRSDLLFLGWNKSWRPQRTVYVCRVNNLRVQVPPFKGC